MRGAYRWRGDSDETPASELVGTIVLENSDSADVLPKNSTGLVQPTGLGGGLWAIVVSVLLFYLVAGYLGCFDMFWRPHSLARHEPRTTEVWIAQRNGFHSRRWMALRRGRGHSRLLGRVSDGAVGVFPRSQ